MQILRMIYRFMEQVFFHFVNIYNRFFFFNSLQIGVFAIHLHRLIIEKPFLFIKETNHQEISIDTFRICINAYALSRYSKTIRVYSTDNIAQLNQTMQMIIRVKIKKRDFRVENF